MCFALISCRSIFIVNSEHLLEQTFQLYAEVILIRILSSLDLSKDLSAIVAIKR